MSSLSMIVRRVGLLACTRRALPRLGPTALKALLSTSTKVKNEEKVDFIRDYNYENPDLQEFYDSWEKMAKKSHHVVNDKENAKEMMDIMAQAKKTFAVDAPDGIADGSIMEEMDNIHKIFDEVSEHKKEVQVRIDKLAAMMREGYAVDSPDGENDGHLREELEEVQHIIDEAAKSPDKDPKKDKIKEAEARKRAADPEHW